MKKIGSFLILFLFSMVTFGQDVQQVEMADLLHQSGKIYVVVAVLSIIFIGIVVYLILLDRKISKLEREIKNK